MKQKPQESIEISQVQYRFIRNLKDCIGSIIDDSLINVTTYVSWINDIMNSERDLYYNKELDSEVIKVNSSQIEGLLQNAKNIASSIHDIGMKKQCNDDIDKANYRYLLSRGQIDVHNENKAPND